MIDFGKYIPWVRSRRRKMWYVIAAVVAIVVVAFFMFVFSPLSHNKIPNEFRSSRVSASDYAQQIVGMLEQTTKNINDLGGGNVYTSRSQIADMISNEINKNKTIREMAVRLALDLEQMAKQIPNIYPESAAQTALVAISQETALIGQLLSYNNDLNQLFLLVQDELMTGIWDYPEMNRIIARVNTGAKEVNELNERFTNEMKKFDAIYE